MKKSEKIWTVENPEETNKIKINPKLIPSWESKMLCKTFLDAVIQFYKDPENEKRFQEWQKEQESSQE